MIEITNCPVCGSSSLILLLRQQAQMHSNKELFNFDECSSCKLVFLNPRLHLDDLKKYYTSYYLPYRGAQAWGKFEKFVASSQTKARFKKG